MATFLPNHFDSNDKDDVNDDDNMMMIMEVVTKVMMMMIVMMRVYWVFVTWQAQCQIIYIDFSFHHSIIL